MTYRILLSMIACAVLSSGCWGYHHGGYGHHDDRHAESDHRR
jgi:hypothetical protein